MTRVLALSGSLRGGSLNTRLLRAAALELPPGGELEVYDALKAVPPFDADDEAAPGDHVQRLRAAVQDADAVLVATPEYNGSLPGQLKNAIDWLSRPKAEAALRGKPAAAIGASTSLFGAVWAQAEARKVLGAAGARVLDRELPLPHAAGAFASDGRLADPDQRAELGSIVHALVAATAPVEALAA